MCYCAKMCLVFSGFTGSSFKILAEIEIPALRI